MENEKSELLKSFQKQPEQFGQQFENPEPKEELPEDLKNRHVRRLEAKLQAEREANIASQARIEALSEAQKLREESTMSKWKEKAMKIYGNEKPENAAASNLLVEAIADAVEDAKRETLEQAREEFQSQAREEQKEVQTVNSYIEQIEDEYGVDFTSNQEAQEKQKQFRDLWFRLSPKDSDGEVVEYADPYEVFEIFNSRQTDRAKDFASRGMTRSHAVETGVQDDATTKYLKENGIIDPF